MKIGIIGAKDRFDSLEFHLNDELKIQGHEVEIFDFKVSLASRKVDYGLGLISPQYIVQKNKSLLSNILASQPDLVIVVYRHLEPFVVKEIKTHGVKIIHINPDQFSTLDKQQIFVEAFDAYFTKDPYMLGFMRDKMNLNAFHYSEAFNPRIHKYSIQDNYVHEKETQIEALAFGNFYPYRNRMIEVLIKEDIDIKLYGYKSKLMTKAIQGKFQNEALIGKEKAKIVTGAKIVFNNLHYAEIESVNNKFFEINGIGGFQICDYRPILNDILPIDPKLVSFESIDEGVKLIKHYLDKPEKRFEYRDVIQKFFLENYTYKHLLESVFGKL